jgi:hypothetical protein
MAKASRAIALLRSSAEAVRENHAYSPRAQVAIVAKLERLASELSKRDVEPADAAAAAACLFPACPDLLRDAVAELERLSLSAEPKTPPRVSEPPAES